MPRVSIIIPNYNRAFELSRCLESVVAQEYRDIEVLVCDDGSTDGSESSALRFQNKLRLRWESSPNFGGPARPRNLGLRAASGELIALLDSDDWWTPDKLRKAVARLDEGSDLVYHDLRMMSASGVIGHIRSSRPRVPMVRWLLCTGMRIPNSSVVVRRSVLEKAGGFSEDRALIAVEDYEAWIRVALQTERFARIPETLGFYWVSGGQASSPSPIQAERIRRLYALHLDLLSPVEQRVARGFLEYRIARIALEYGDAQAAIHGLMRAARAPLRMLDRVRCIAHIAAIMLRNGRATRRQRDTP